MREHCISAGTSVIESALITADSWRSSELSSDLSDMYRDTNAVEATFRSRIYGFLNPRGGLSLQIITTVRRQIPFNALQWGVVRF